MAPKNLPVVRLALLGYSDGWRAVRAMPLLFGCAVLIILAVKIGEDFFWFRGWQGVIRGNLLSLAVSGVRGFLLTPVMIAVHRFIIRDEVTRGYDIDLSRNFLRFFGWAFLLSALFALVFVVWELLGTFGGSQIPALIVLFIMVVMLVIFALRLTILFPALAVDAQGATAANAIADTRGSALRIFAIFVLAIIPMLALSILVTIAIGRGVTIRNSPSAILDNVLGAVIQTFTTALMVAIASRIFQGTGSKIHNG